MTSVISKTAGSPDAPPLRSSDLELDYRIKSPDVRNPHRPVRVQATPQQILRLQQEGYLVRERLISGELLSSLREAADEIAGQAGGEAAAGGGGFGGLFARNLLDRHPAFLKMLDFGPTVSVARAVLGPQVQVHAFVLRVSYPNAPQAQQVEWHFHQRVVPEPLPVFFYRPSVIDNLIYLDDITEASGPLVVMPRTHLLDEDLPTGDFEDKPGQVVVTVPAGSCITSHGSLWHRAMPTQPNGTTRRLLILSYSPAWMKQIDRPCGDLTESLRLNGEESARELLGVSGWM